ncbi:PBP1A family penicillin-binding protein [Patescibacteria group bacterium]|nr:PBP1A family penicillin-binding protein [Patescibacteria group bacterium]
MDYKSSRRRQRKVRVSWVFLFNKIVLLFLLGIIACIVAVPVLFLWFSRDLPTPGRLVVSKYKDATRIYDRKGVLLYSVYQDENRTYVKLADIPKALKEATISIEDSDFYKNQGFSPVAYLRVAKNFLAGKGLAGGSTISQQLVKNVLLSSERSLPRKIKELILSVQVNQKYSKDEILEMYLNNIAYGGTSIGVEAASEMYFGKKVKQLDLAECVFLAGLPQSPSIYSPFSGNKYYLGRTQAVLNQMVENEYISRIEADKTYKRVESFKFSQKYSSIKAPHFVMYVKDKLEEQFGSQMVLSGGLQVTTTLDFDIEKKAEEIVKDEIDKLKGYNVNNGSAVVADPKTGEILAMVGSKDYFNVDIDGNFNVATSNNRNPGSSLKPIIYVAAFEKGYTPATMVIDARTEFPSNDPEKPYIPVNYDGKFRGPVQLRFALGNSLNIPAVKVMSLVGVDAGMKKAYDMGIRNWEPTSENKAQVGLSLVLGGRGASLMDIVTAYSVFANKGVKQEPVTILNVTDTQGKVLYEYKKKEGKQVVSSEIAFLISHILLDNNARAMEFGTQSWLQVPGKTVSVKTGTTDEKRDNWTVGYTSSVVAGVWVGNSDNSPMNPAIASGVTGASPIWNKIMSYALKNKPDEQPVKPDNVIALQIDSFAGGLPHGGQGTRSEYFIKGTEPTSESSIYRSKDGQNYLVFREDDPVSTDGINHWQKGIDDWLNTEHKDDKMYHPPDEVVNPPAQGSEPSPTSSDTPQITEAPILTPVLSVTP